MHRIACKLILLLLPLVTAAKGEIDYAKAWAAEHNGKTEVLLEDGTRCDILTPEHAIEVEFARSWYEAIGQSLWYAFQTNRRAGIVLVLKKDSDRKFLLRLQSLIAHHELPIDVWTIGP